MRHTALGIRSFVLVILLLPLVGCAVDVTPGVAAADGMLASHQSTYDGIRAVLNHPKVTIDPAVRAKILGELETDFDNTSRFHRVLVAFLAELGKGVDWQQRANELRDFYDKMRAER